MNKTLHDVHGQEKAAIQSFSVYIQGIVILKKSIHLFFMMDIIYPADMGSGKQNTSM